MSSSQLLLTPEGSTAQPPTRSEPVWLAVRDEAQPAQFRRKMGVAKW